MGGMAVSTIHRSEKNMYNSFTTQHRFSQLCSFLMYTKLSCSFVPTIAGRTKVRLTILRPMRWGGAAYMLVMTLS